MNNNLKAVQISKSLYMDIAVLIEQSRSFVALTINREITILNYNIGKTISISLLKYKRLVM